GFPGAIPSSFPQLAQDDGLVAEWSSSTGKLLAKPMLLPGGGAASGGSFSPRGPIVVVTQFGHPASVLHPARPKDLSRWNGSPTAQSLLGTALSPDGTRVATADLEGYLWVRDAATGKPLLPGIRASASYVYSVGWSPDGTRLVTAGSDGTVRLYD